ncbi:hypothetical protein J6590_085350 [Homalodisca vitripennis]|nr:hypothetical protein J6590_085350 [Homalodisca vitripennis]
MRTTAKLTIMMCDTFALTSFTAVGSILAMIKNINSSEREIAASTSCTLFMCVGDGRCPEYGAMVTYTLHTYIQLHSFTAVGSILAIIKNINSYEREIAVSTSCTLFMCVGDGRCPDYGAMVTYTLHTYIQLHRFTAVGSILAMIKNINSSKREIAVSTSCTLFMCVGDGRCPDYGAMVTYTLHTYIQLHRFTAVGSILAIIKNINSLSREIAVSTSCTLFMCVGDGRCPDYGAMVTYTLHTYIQLHSFTAVGSILAMIKNINSSEREIAVSTSCTLFMCVGDGRCPDYGAMENTQQSVGGTHQLICNYNMNNGGCEPPIQCLYFCLRKTHNSLSGELTS